MTETSWSAFPSTRSTKLWISSSDRVFNALRLYNPYSRAGKLVKLLLCHTPEFIARRLLPTLRDPQVIHHLDKLSAHIEQTLGRQIQTASFSAGTPGPHQKFTAQLSAHGKVLAYAKIGESTAARHLIQQETKILQFLSKQEIFPFKMPGVISSSDSENCTILIQSTPSNGLVPRTVILSRPDLDALAALANIGKNNAPINEIINTKRKLLLHSGNPKIETSTSLENAFVYLQDAFSSEKVHTHFAHGDYAPWNTATLPDGQHYIFDWEYGDTGIPALNDLIHYIFMPIRLIQRCSAKATVQKLLKRLKTKHCRDFCNKLDIAEDKRIAYVLLYLLQIAARTVRNEGEIDHFILGCIHCTLIKAKPENGGSSVRTK